MADPWVKRWGYTIRATPVRRGIYRLKPTGFLVRGRATVPGTSKRKAVLRALPGAKIEEAQRTLDDLKERARAEARGAAPRRQPFASFAASLFLAKVNAGEIKSRKGIEWWKGTLERQLLPEFGEVECRKLDADRCSRWRDKLAVKMREGHAFAVRMRNGKAREATTLLSPQTANGWMRIMRVICRAMVDRLELPRDPSKALKPFDLSQRPTYTDESPNSLTPGWAARFLSKMRELFPQHYAMTLLGFFTGKRPSTLRPLRASGPQADLDWTTGRLLFRRSHTRKQDTMVGTKTLKHETVYLPAEVVAELRAHLDTIANPPESKWRKPPVWWRPKMAKSALLFPALHGGMRTSSVLDKPFAEVARAIGLPFPLTPRAMRRTFNDLARAAKVHDVVTRSITGHLTETMQEHYSTAAAEEQRAAISSVLGLVRSVGEVTS